VAVATLGGRGGDQPESVVQDGVTRALERLDQFRGDTARQFLGWVAAVVRSRARERLRRPPAAALPEGSSGQEVIPASGSTPSSNAARLEEAARMMAAVERLPWREREAVRLRNLEGLSHAEIAQRLSITEEAARKLWSRAVRRLRTDLEADA
jgi:RNA polymerase sigma-70 factor (ECF subfamily)